MRIGKHVRQVLFGLEFGAVSDELGNLFQGAEAIQGSQSVREEVSLMVLGGCLPGEIAEWYGFEEYVVRAWEGTFFDVRDMIQATDWLYAHVLEPERLSGNLKFAAKLSLAIRGGSEIAKRLLTMESSPPTDDAEQRRVEELELAMNSWLAVNQPFRSEKDRQQMLQYKQRLDEIDRQTQVNRSSESENEQHLRELIESVQIKTGSAFPFWSSLAEKMGQVAQTDPAVDQMTQG